MRLSRTISGVVALAALVCAVPVCAQTLPSSSGPHVILYELTENMKLTGGKLTRRLATAALAGFAVSGTPICPTGVSTSGFCQVHAIGSDNISTRTGEGSLHGSFAVTVQDGVSVDGPELVVLKGNFNGSIDLSSALLGGAPIGTMTGGMVVAAGGGRTPIEGVFRLPFVGSLVCGIDVPCGLVSGVTLRQLFCGPDQTPNPNLPVDFIYIASGPTGVPTGCIDVQPSETLFGSPMVRLDIWFQ